MSDPIDQYDRAFQRMKRTFRDAFERPSLDVFLFQIGRHRSGDTDGWRTTRAAQKDIAESNDGIHSFARIR